MSRRAAALLVLLAALVAAPAASAHFAFVPSEVPARSLALVELQVPNEEPDASTVRVAVQVPEPVVFVRVLPTPGWQVRVEREPLERPVLVGKRRVEERIAVIEWTGGEITGTDTQSFRLRLAVPPPAGRTLVFRATQTYSDGQVVQWVGEPGSERPAPTLTVMPPDPSAGTIEIRPAPPPPAPPPPPPPPPPTTTEEETTTEETPEAAPEPAAEDEDDGVSVPLLVGLAVVLAIVLAGAGWLLGRRGRTGP